MVTTAAGAALISSDLASDKTEGAQRWTATSPVSYSHFEK